MSMATNLEFGKLKELIVCLVGSTDVGLTKLEKLMYLCDFSAAEKLGRPITGETYRHFQLGPVPKHFVPAMNELVESGTISKTEVQLAPEIKYVQLKSTRKCEETTFSPEELGIIEQVVAEYGKKNAKELVALTHKELTWDLTERNEDIPYFLAAYRNYKKLTEAEALRLLEAEGYRQSIRQGLEAAKAA